MSADDFQPFPQDAAFPSELDSASPYTGNRPASGARRSTPGEVLSQGFQGAENAGDFLGLDVEFTASQDPALFAGSGELDLRPPPTTQVDPATQGFGPADMGDPVADPVPGFSETTSSFAFGEDLGSEDLDLGLEPQPAKSKRSLVAGVLLALGLGAAGYLYGPQLVSRFTGGATEVARQPDPTPPKPSSKEPRTQPTEVASVTPEAPASPTGAAPNPPKAPPAATPSAGSARPSPEAKEPETPRSSAPFAEPSATAPSDLPSAGDLLAGLLGSPLANTGAPSGVLPQPIFPDLSGAEYEWASEDQLEMIWRGASVPMEAVQAPAKTLMPRVGNVRVFTVSGDVFEGRLYAVGQNRVWIDSAPGRIGLDGERVERIEVLPPGPLAEEPGELTVAGSKRVRVRVPGGMLFGRVLKVEGDDVTLALDEGGRVHVKSADVEELGTGRAIVVRR